MSLNFSFLCFLTAGLLKCSSGRKYFLAMNLSRKSHQGAYLRDSSSRMEAFSWKIMNFQNVCSTSRGVSQVICGWIDDTAEISVEVTHQKCRSTSSIVVVCNYCLIEKRLTTLNCLQPNSASTAMLNGRIFIDSLCFRAERHHSVTSTHNAEMNEINETRFGEYHEYMMVNIKGTLRGGRAQLFTLVAKYLVEHFYVCFLLVVVISYITLPAIITWSSLPGHHFSSNRLRRSHTLTHSRHRAEDFGGCLARIMML